MTIRSTKTLKIAAAAAAIAITGAAVPGAITPAEAKKIIIKGSHHHHPHYGRYVVGGLALATVYGASQSCYWLKVRAARTGSEYWWDRYQACLGD